MNLKELTNFSAIENGTRVTVSKGEIYFTGKIIGKGADCLNQTYIVQCTDGFIPNDTYKYDACIIPLSEIIV